MIGTTEPSFSQGRQTNSLISVNMRIGSTQPPPRRAIHIMSYKEKTAKQRLEELLGFDITEEEYANFCLHQEKVNGVTQWMTIIRNGMARTVGRNHPWGERDWTEEEMEEWAEKTFPGK
jgi:hypothetical protein